MPCSGTGYQFPPRFALGWGTNTPHALLRDGVPVTSVPYAFLAQGRGTNALYVLLRASRSVGRQGLGSCLASSSFCPLWCLGRAKVFACARHLLDTELYPRPTETHCAQFWFVPSPDQRAEGSPIFYKIVPQSRLI